MVFSGKYSELHSRMEKEARMDGVDCDGKVVWERKEDGEKTFRMG